VAARPSGSWTSYRVRGRIVGAGAKEALKSTWTRIWWILLLFYYFLNMGGWLCVGRVEKKGFSSAAGGTAAP
jgi:hypothetical protein